MLTTLTYLLKVSIWFIPLYILYLALYKKFTFFSWNRYYLLFIAIASFVLPFIQFDIVTKEVIISNINELPAPFTIAETVETSPNTTPIEQINLISTAGTFNWFAIPFAIYIIGALAAFVKLSKGLFGIRKLIKQSQKNWTDNLALVHTNDKMPHSSFFHFIFLNNKTKNGEDIEKIIYHEMQHNEKLHTIDVLFCEVLKIIFWFNPFIYWYKKSLQEIHEFEVDNEMTKLYNEVTYAELLLKIATANSGNALVNPFSTKPLKTRLKMIFNHKTYPLKKLSFLLVLPLIAGLLLAFGNVQHKTISIIKSDDKKLTIVVDAGHGGEDKGAINEGLQESDINLTLALLLKEKAAAAGYNIVLTRPNETFVTLKERAKILEQTNADAAISIHINSAKNKDDNGIEYYSADSASNTSFKESVLFGERICNSIKTLNSLNVNKVPQKRSVGIYILKSKINYPLVLMECGYLSNTKDYDFLSDKQNLNALSDKIVEGFNDFFKLDKLQKP